MSQCSFRWELTELQYDIPVLHRAESSSFEALSGRTGEGGGRIMKHRIDKEKLRELVVKWTEELNREGSTS